MSAPQNLSSVPTANAVSRSSPRYCNMGKQSEFLKTSMIRMIWVSHDVISLAHGSGGENM